jgi:uncharacterized protein YycO
MPVRTRFMPVPRAGVRRYGAGEEATDWQPGDFILTHGDAWTSRLIRIGQRLRIRGRDAVFTYWNHAAMVVSDHGDLIEALGGGVSRTDASKYRAKDYHVIDSGASSPDRDEAVAFASWCADEQAPYGFVTLASIAWTLLTGAKFSFFVDGSEICSGLVARCQERTGAIFNRDPIHIMPADLAKYFQVEPPTGES